MWAREVLVSRWMTVVQLAERQSRLWDVLEVFFDDPSTEPEPHPPSQLQRFSGYYPYYEQVCEALCIRINHSDYYDYPS